MTNFTLKYSTVLLAFMVATMTSVTQANSVALEQAQQQTELKPIAAYVQQSIEKNAARLTKLGFSEDELNGVYGIPLRNYLSVIINDPEIRIFREETAIADFVVVVKPTAKPSSKYYFDYDYGDLIPKAINYEVMGLSSGLKLITSLPDKEITFGTLYATRYNEQLKKDVKR